MKRGFQRLSVQRGRDRREPVEPATMVIKVETFLAIQRELDEIERMLNQIRSRM